MSNIICPFCQQELRKIHPTYVICDNCRITGEDKLWQELIRTKKQLVTKCNQLDVAVDALKSAHEYYEHCVEREKQPYEEINWDCTAMNMDNDISEALEQITAPEQKDAK